MKRTLIVFGLLVALVMIMAGWRQCIAPLNEISEIRKEFATIARGDSEAVVLAKMRTSAMTSSSLSAPFWDEQRLSDEEAQNIQRSIGQRIDTFLIPVIFVISFNHEGLVIGKHIYD